jgi:hypothetical protein
MVTVLEEIQTLVDPALITHSHAILALWFRVAVRLCKQLTSTL